MSNILPDSIYITLIVSTILVTIIAIAGNLIKNRPRVQELLFVMMLVIIFVTLMILGFEVAKL